MLQCTLLPGSEDDLMCPGVSQLALCQVLQHPRDEGEGVCTVTPVGPPLLHTALLEQEQEQEQEQARTIYLYDPPKAD